MMLLNLTSLITFERFITREDVGLLGFALVTSLTPTTLPPTLPETPQMTIPTKLYTLILKPPLMCLPNIILLPRLHMQIIPPATMHVNLHSPINSLNLDHDTIPPNPPDSPVSPLNTHEAFSPRHAHPFHPLGLTVHLLPPFLCDHPGFLWLHLALSGPG